MITLNKNMQAKHQSKFFSEFKDIKYNFLNGKKKCFDLHLYIYSKMAQVHKLNSTEILCET